MLRCVFHIKKSRIRWLRLSCRNTRPAEANVNNFFGLIKKNASVKGFTLIELMITIVILTILMGFAIPEVINQIQMSKYETRKQNIKEIKKAIDEHYADRGRYPETLKDLTKVVDNPVKYFPDGRPKTYTPYFTDLPIDPVTGDSGWEIGVEWKEKDPPDERIDKPKKTVRWYRTSRINYPGAPIECPTAKEIKIDGIDYVSVGIINVRARQHANP